MTTATAPLDSARAAVNALTFGTPEWEAAMQTVRDLCASIDASAPAEEFCSVDQGDYPTRLSDGRIVSTSSAPWPITSRSITSSPVEMLFSPMGVTRNSPGRRAATGTSAGASDVWTATGTTLVWP